MKKKNTLKMTSQLIILVLSFFVPPTLINLKKITRKSTNKKNLALRITPRMSPDSVTQTSISQKLSWMLTPRVAKLIFLHIEYLNTG